MWSFCEEKKLAENVGFLQEEISLAARTKASVTSNYYLCVSCNEENAANYTLDNFTTFCSNFRTRKKNCCSEILNNIYTYIIYDKKKIQLEQLLIFRIHFMNLSLNLK